MAEHLTNIKVEINFMTVLLGSKQCGHSIVRAFLPTVVAVCLKKAYKKEGTGTPGSRIVTPLMKHFLLKGDKLLLIAHIFLPVRNHLSS